MKKSLIALAVAAGTIAAAQAADTTTLYGSLGFSSTVTKTDKVGDAFKGVKENTWDIETAASKIGVKGTEDLSNGTQAFFKFELGGDDNAGLNKTNRAYIGFKGDFGKVTIGKQKTLFKEVTDTGLFEQVGVSHIGDVVEEANKADYTASAPLGAAGKVISYITPDMSGLKLGASVQADADNKASKGADAWELAAMYEQNGFNAGVVYNHAKGMTSDQENAPGVLREDTVESTGLNVGYSNDQYDVVGRVLRVSSIATEYGIEGQYKFDKNTLRAGVGLTDLEGDAGKVYTYALGYKYNFSDRTYTWVEGQYDDIKVEGEKDGFTALVGVRHDF